MDRHSRRNLLKRLMKQQHGKCVYCSRQTTPVGIDGVTLPTSATIDHVHPQVKGGADDPSNMVLACHECNTHKGHALHGRSGPTIPQTLARYQDPIRRLEAEAWLLALDSAFQQLQHANPRDQKRAIWAAYSGWEHILLEARPAAFRHIQDCGMYLRDRAVARCWEYRVAALPLQPELRSESAA